jgi:hypothetical protein
VLPAPAPQPEHHHARRVRELASRVEKDLGLNDCLLRVHDAEIDHRIDFPDTLSPEITSWLGTSIICDNNFFVRSSVREQLSPRTSITLSNRVVPPCCAGRTGLCVSAS